MLCRSPTAPPQGPIGHTLSRTRTSPHKMPEPAGQPDNSKRAGAGSHTPTQTGWWIRILGRDSGKPQLWAREAVLGWACRPGVPGWRRLLGSG